MIKSEFGNVSQRADGYLYITSKLNNGKLLHRLIYEKAYGSIPEGYSIHHIDGNKLNNSIDNLEAIPKSKHHHLHNNGESHPLWGSSLIDSNGGIDYLILEKSKGKSMTQIAKELGYTTPVPIFQYLKLRGLCWKEL